MPPEVGGGGGVRAVLQRWARGGLCAAPAPGEGGGEVLGRRLGQLRAVPPLRAAGAVAVRRLGAILGGAVRSRRPGGPHAAAAGDRKSVV